MIEQIKMGMRMLRYAFGIKICVVCMVLFFILGIVFLYLPTQIAGSFGGLMVVLGAMWVQQLIFSLPAANMVQASPWKKALQTSIPALLGLLGSLLLYVVVTLISALQLLGADEAGRQIVANGLLIDGIYIFLLLVYSGVAYKWFIAATVGFFVAFYTVTGVFNVMSAVGSLPELSFAAAAGIGGLCMIVGALAEYGLSLLFYKAPLSKRAQMRGLQKYM